MKMCWRSGVRTINLGFGIRSSSQRQIIWPRYRFQYRSLTSSCNDLIRSVGRIILDLTVVLNFAIDGVWINSLDDFGERFREKSVSQLL